VSKILALLCSVLPDVDGDWDRLVSGAAPNVFMSPAALSAADASGVSRIKVLQAWDGSGDGKRLVGLWGLQKRRVLRFGPKVLTAPPYDYAFVANPVVAPDRAGEAVAALLDAIAGDPALPKVVCLKHLDADAETYRALEAHLAARGIASLTLGEHLRPFATRSAGIKSSGSTRKKLRQDWNRLARLGAIDVVNESRGEGAQEAFEVFLTLEAGSWKGSNGTALLSRDRDAAFVRRFFAGLSADGSASVALLLLDGKAIAAQVLLYSGSMAYTWKTAFDAAYARFSPGALLVDKVTEQLLQTGAIEAIESCSPAGSFMARLWSGRRRTVDLLIDLGPRRSMGFVAMRLWEQGYQRLREVRNELRTAAWLPDPRRRSAV